MYVAASVWINDRYVNGLYVKKTKKVSDTFLYIFITCYIKALYYISVKMTYKGYKYDYDLSWDTIHLVLTVAMMCISNTLEMF